MKNRFLNILKFTLAVAIIAGFSSCDDYLDRAPLSDVTPDDYLWSESDLAAYAVARYNFPTHAGWGPGTFGNDNHTDNQASSGYANRWVPGEYRVGSSGGAWGFGEIRNCNYFFETVIPRWEDDELTGNPDNIEHYIGEMYFLRAYEYFNKLQALGDFPILRETLVDDKDQLVDASVRQPRNEVARFIIEDLENAIELLSEDPPGGTNRVNLYAAKLFLSRVALFEGSWLTYHRGTAHVPGGPGWPGDEHHPDFAYENGIDGEIEFFLEKAMEYSEQVADYVQLTPNDDDNLYDLSNNSYYNMYISEDLHGVSEVLLWRDYDESLGVSHNVSHYLNRNGGNTGYTRGLVENVLMNNGLPIYYANSGYQGDDYLEDVITDRDDRLRLFMKLPGQLRYTDATTSDGDPVEEGIPQVTIASEQRYVTGYAVKKGMSYLHSRTEDHNVDISASIVFRGVEAYLNYIEASYLLNGEIDSKADQYWRAIRERAGIEPDYNVTIAATDISEEAKNDFAAYSAGQLLDDATLYNIRRERRIEFIAEGMRYNDLRRWRAMDQLMDNPYIIEGFKLWGPMEQWYIDEDIDLIQPEDDGTANVSSRSESEYLRPYRINLRDDNHVRDGYRWAKAHYLEPIAVQHFQITAEDPDDNETSVIYQNPYWPVRSNEGALE
ncbi:RagB/SusD family nutrient uptake outer membrane protein [Marinilabiliaceae bacterium ANBcel2]|nr:RagB/SusD family nutrient uptake outer membrane protein [Marinilabiliaceae bacterium ANBcel2]